MAHRRPNWSVFEFCVGFQEAEPEPNLEDAKQGPRQERRRNGGQQTEGLCKRRSLQSTRN